MGPEWRADGPDERHGSGGGGDLPRYVAEEQHTTKKLKRKKLKTGRP